MTGDIDSQTAQFADIEKIKIDSHFGDFEQIMTDPTRFFTNFGQVTEFTEFGQDDKLRKTIPTLSVWQKIQERRIGWYKSFSMIQSAEIRVS